jgi:glutamyl-tRNA reductase
LKDPILQAKELAAQPEADKSLELFKKIFNIEELVERQQPKAAKVKITLVSNPQASFQS